MGWQGKRAVALGSLLVALAVGFAACGGNDSSSEGASSTDVGTTAATGASGATGSDATGVAGTTGSKGSATSGGSRAPSTPSKGTPGGSSQKRSDKSSGKSAPKKNYNPSAVGKPSPGELSNLYTQAREVCKILTLHGLASEYRVAETPSAVAKAYSKAYPADQRAAVYNGCKAGVS